MPLFDSAWGLISSVMVFIFGALICLALAKKFNISLSRAIFIYVWHTLFCMIYANYISKFGGDAQMYYSAPIYQGVDFKFGTMAVKYLSQTIKESVQLSFGGVFLVFNIFGAVGLLAFDSCLSSATRESSNKLKRIASLIVFLPSVSFWTSAIGKDSLAFMSVGLALWASLNMSNRMAAMIFAVLIMLFVRPHIAAIMVASLALSFALSNKIQIFHRIFLAVLSISAATVIVPLALVQTGFGVDLDEASLVSYVEKRQSYNMEGGGGIDISSMPLPLQVFTYLFRPLPFEAHSIFSFAASIDNIILIYLFYIGLPKIFKISANSFAEQRSFLWIYALSSWVILSVTTANMGISMRQKWMFVPILIFLLLSAASRVQAEKKKVATHKIDFKR